MKSSNKGKDFLCICAAGPVLLPGSRHGTVYLRYLPDLNRLERCFQREKLCRTFQLSQPLCATRSSGKSLLLTFKYVIAVVVLVNVIAFLLAYILTRGIKGQNFFRAGFFTPNLIGGIVLGYIWQFVFSRVFVSIGETTGWSLFEISWLSTPTKHLQRWCSFQYGSWQAI